MSAALIVVTEDLPGCPQCGAPAVATGGNRRQCNCCGLTWAVVTAEDELDSDAQRLVMSRQSNEDAGRARKIERLQTQW